MNAMIPVVRMQSGCADMNIMQSEGVSNNNNIGGTAERKSSPMDADDGSALHSSHRNHWW